MNKILSLKAPFRYALAVFLGLLPGIVFFWALTYPVYKSMGKVERELEQKRSELARLKLLASEFIALKKEVEKLEKRLKEIELLLPSSPNIPSFIDDVSFLSKKYQILTKSLVFSQPVKEGDVFCVPVEMGLQGTYHSIGLFLSELSGKNRIISVEDFTFSKKGEVVDAKCFLKVYYSKGRL